MTNKDISEALHYTQMIERNADEAQIMDKHVYKFWYIEFTQRPREALIIIRLYSKFKSVLLTEYHLHPCAFPTCKLWHGSSKMQWVQSI